MSSRYAMNNITRRDAIKAGLLGAAGLTLGPIPTFAAKPAAAKSVIQIWMWGGPCHLDTFDPKPEAGSDYCGPYEKPIKTNVSGIRICEKLPLLAKQADKYSIIRSMTHGINGHETASYMVQTGRKPGGDFVYPSAGAVVSKFRGYDAGYKGLIPPYIVLTRPQGRFSEAGFMGSRYKPFATGGDPKAQVFAVEGVVAQGISKKQQRERRELLHKLDTLGRVMPETPSFNKLDKGEKTAYDLILGDAGKIFDLSEEDDEMRDAYGRSTFGQSCLMARRLVEQGVPYITINYKGWDSHKKHFETMNTKLPELDQGMAMLLQDLSDRGLLDSTIVWWGGEFGRKPKIDWKAPWNGGRSHFGACFSHVLAGGGFKGGQVIGESDKKGMTVKDRAVYPCDLIGSMYAKLGIDPTARLPHPQNKPVTVCAADTDNVKSGGLLTEIM